MLCLKGTFKGIKMDRKNSDFYFVVGLGNRTVLGVEVCCASVKCYPFTNNFSFHSAPIHDAWALRVVCSPQDQQCMNQLTSGLPRQQSWAVASNKKSL